MLSGTLNKRLIIEVATITNVDGEPVASWETVNTVWANIKYLSGRELERAQQLHEEANVLLSLRYLHLTSDMRCRRGNKTFEIVGIVPDDKERELSVTCIARNIQSVDMLAEGGAITGGASA